jgi:two-component system, cell cycle sensor histidine kinase and response regulator CckA
VEFVSNVNRVDQLKVIQCNIRDITARKRTERALEESEAKMRGILDNIGIGVSLISPGMEVLEVNHRIVNIGKITIETENASLDEVYCADHAGFTTGEYVLLAVSDDGCGMDKAILDHIFEPFFTTKGIGQGTGLGLSTVYGIVKQNNGFINAYSEPEKGTTFRIYLPRNADPAADTQRIRETELPLGLGETVLVVEDEPSLRTLAKIMLEKLGYRVLTTGIPGETIKLAEDHANEIHLLITDVVMPEMNGLDLAKQLQPLYPGMKYLFMSGYTASVIAHRDVLDEGVIFIQKPFSMKDLAIKVREALRER